MKQMMHRHLRLIRVTVTIAVVSATALGLAFARGPQPAPAPKPEPKFIGAAKCGNCHEAKSKGSQLSTWKASTHANAFTVLAGEEAKKIAKEKGIADPQKADACLKCHVTGHGEPAARFAKGFDRTQGVQCESCHGAGEAHFKARFAAAAQMDEEEADELQEVPAGEIPRPGLDVCLRCHNSESPRFKPFCFKKGFAAIAHFDPRKERDAKELEAMKCACGDDCQCAQGECGGLHAK